MQIGERTRRYITQTALILGYVGCLYSLGGNLGAFADQSSELGLRVRNAAFAMPIVTVFGFLSTRFLIKRTFFALDAIVLTSKNNLNGEALKNKFRRKTQWLRYLSIAAGIVLTGFYLFVEGLFAMDLDPLIVFMNISAIPFWSANSFLIANLFFITRYLVVNFLDKESLDFFSLRELKPISDLVLYNLAVCAGFLALMPVFWLGKTIPMLDLYLLFGVFICFALYLFIPVFKVHFTLSKQKRLAIERINFAIRQLMLNNKIDSDTQFVSQPENLRQLASLVSAKQELHAASEWPIDLPQGIKGVFITMGIPLSWAAGSMVETLISTMTIFNA